MECKRCEDSGRVFKEGFYPCPLCNEDSVEYQLAKEKAEREIEKTVDSEAVLGLREEVEQLQTENKQLKKQFNCLAELVIFRHPETWEYYLEDIKQAQKGKQ